MRNMLMSLIKWPSPTPSPALPAFRLLSDHCFQTCGLDFAGPVLVKGIYGSTLEMNKSHICLFTCGTSREIHLELVPDLEAATFICAFKIFIIRCRTPSFMISDNAQTFKSNMVKSFFQQKGIESSFILVASPWWGGFSKPLVRVVKSPLKKAIGKARVSYKEMETMLVEVEGIINTHPPTYIYEDVGLETHRHTFYPVVI